jgi:hypothetical protein
VRDRPARHGGATAGSANASFLNRGTILAGV